MKNIPYELIARYLAGECNQDEKQEVLKWIENHPEEMAELSSIWEQMPINDFNPDVEAALISVNRRIEVNTRKHSKKMILWICSTAAAIALIISGIWWSKMQESTGDIFGGPVLALETKEKESIEFILPDGSKVWLNHLSSLKYPEEFSENKREVYLEGEAFFDIAPDASKPFIIHANKTQTRVVGTSFGVKALKETDEVVVTVATGIINFSVQGKTNEYIELKKGEQGVCKLEKKKLEKKEVSDLNFLAWKTKIFTFKDTPIQEVAKMVGEIYLTPITVDSSITDLKITSTFDQLDLDEIIQIIEITLGINAETKDDGIYLVSQ